MDLVDVFLMRLYLCAHRLTRQQLKTLRGQALAGDIAGAEKGLERLLTRGEKS